MHASSLRMNVSILVVVEAARWDPFTDLFTVPIMVSILVVVEAARWVTAVIQSDSPSTFQSLLWWKRLVG